MCHVWLLCDFLDGLGMHVQMQSATLYFCKLSGIYQATKLLKKSQALLHYFVAV